MPALRVPFAGKATLVLFALGAASAQVYPPVGYPTGYPQGGGIPIPGRSRTQPTPTNTKNQPMPNTRGLLKRMDDKVITLALDDDRILDFHRNSKTKFYKGGDEVKDPHFNPGDQLSIEGPVDSTGYMTAVNVYWEKAAAGSSTASAKSGDSKVPDAWAADNNTASTQSVKPAATRDPDDPGPPTLQRGSAADPKREKAAPLPEITPEQVAANTPPPSGGNPNRGLRRNADDDTPIAVPKQEDLIRRAADTAMNFTETLPNYICQEVMSRYQSESRPASWHANDVVTMELLYENGKEDYRKIAINGKAVNKKMEEMGGAWSTGEFGTILLNLFHPGTAATFHYTRDSRIAGVMAKEYDFNVTHDHSTWNVHAESQEYDPAYKGTVWIDPQTARVMRIEMQGYGFPSSFPLDDVETSTDYEYTRLGDAHQYLLPVHAETLSCQRGTPYCSRNTIDFRNYRKYTGESTITFGDPTKK